MWMGAGIGRMLTGFGAAIQVDGAPIGIDEIELARYASPEPDGEKNAHPPPGSRMPAEVERHNAPVESHAHGLHPLFIQRDRR